MQISNQSKKTLVNLLSNGAEDKVINILIEARTNDQEFIKSVVLLSAKYVSATKDFQVGIIEQEKYHSELQRIRNALLDLLEDLPTDIQINAVIINNSKRWVQAQKVLFLAGFILFSALTYWLLSQKPNVEMHLRIKAGAVSLSKFRMPDDQELLFKDIQVSDFKISNPGNCLETFAVDTSVPMSVSSAKIQNIECQGEIFISTNEDGFNTASDVNTELRLLLDKSSTINYEIYPHGTPCQMVLHLRKLAIETDDSIKIEKKVNADSVYFINGTGQSSIVNGELIIGKLNNPLKIISLLKDSDLKIESNSEMYLTNFLLNNKKGIELTFNGPLRYIKMDGNHITVNNIEWYWHYYRMALTVFVVGIVVVFIVYLKKWK